MFGTAAFQYASTFGVQSTNESWGPMVVCAFRRANYQIGRCNSCLVPRVGEPGAYGGQGRNHERGHPSNQEGWNPSNQGGAVPQGRAHLQR